MATPDKKSTRSLDRLDRPVELTIRMIERAGYRSARVSALCERLRRAQANLDAHRKAEPLDKRAARQQGDQILEALIELLAVVETIEKNRG
jgi:hypothetical protein